MKLPDIFVFPDLDPHSDIKHSRIQYMDSEKLLENTIAERIIFLEGEIKRENLPLKNVMSIVISEGHISHYGIW